MCPDCTADRAILKRRHMSLPQGAAVFYIFLKQFISQSRISKHNRHIIINSAGFLYVLNQKIIALSGTARFAYYLYGPILNGNDRLD